MEKAASTREATKEQKVERFVKWTTHKKVEAQQKAKILRLQRKVTDLQRKIGNAKRIRRLTLHRNVGWILFLSILVIAFSYLLFTPWYMKFFSLFMFVSCYLIVLGIVDDELKLCELEG